MSQPPQAQSFSSQPQRARKCCGKLGLAAEANRAEGTLMRPNPRA
ncbi:MAG: hypothetical protein KatS3mg054_0038 [Chloroflexus sp.]|nr:MAG: hypothetical protein KatS3mg054_0038 [Chloroflexus sp.]